MERRFGEKVPLVEEFCSSKVINSDADKEALLKWLRTDEIGGDVLIESPFGCRKVYYCDYAASARSLKSFENYISSEVLPLYGNTHSSITVTSEQMTLFYHESRDVIRNATGASEHDAVLFAGNGTTAAVQLLIHLIKLDIAPIVITGIHEHHSNLLPWREIAHLMYTIGETQTGQINLNELDELLEMIRKSKDKAAKIIGCFTAVSNVTGIIVNIEEVTECLKKWNCLSFWDYAAAAPCIDIVMNGRSKKDAVYFSGHKFVGGVQTPGVLIVKKEIIENSRPLRPGGGTISFVSRTSHDYLKDVEYREEAGTADVVGAVRLALAFMLKISIGCDVLLTQEEKISRYVINRLSKNDRIILLGAPVYKNRLSVFSFLIKDNKSSLFLHHNYVSVLLNDLFGIQSRSGCVCTGPYAQHLLGIHEELALAYRSVLREDDRLDREHLRRKGEYSQKEMLRPGFTRVSFPYYASNAMIQFVVNAIEFVAERGLDFINQYQLNCESGEWHHFRHRVFRARRWLGLTSFGPTGLKIRKKQTVESVTFKPPENLMVDAHALAKESVKMKIEVPDCRNILDLQERKLRWFVLVDEVKSVPSGHDYLQLAAPFQPRAYPFVSELSHISESSEVNDFKCTYNGNASFSQVSVRISQACDVIDVNEEFDDGDSVHNTSTPQRSEGDACSACDAECMKFAEEDVKNEASGLINWNNRIVVYANDDPPAEFHPAWVVPPVDLYKQVTKAINSLNMIEDGDKILVCLSGGKDSLSLLHILCHYQRRAMLRKKLNFKLGAVTVDPHSSAYNPKPLIAYCKSLNIDYFYEQQDIIGQAAKLPKCRSICGFCSRMKRGRLAAAAKLQGYNVLAMGHHMDDLAESFLIAAFHGGNLSTMKATYITRDNLLKIIRPLIYVREKQLREFAESNNLPIIAENCPACFEQPKERHRLKQLLASYELIFPQLFTSLKTALEPLLKVNSPYTHEMRKSAIENITSKLKNCISDGDS